MARPSKFTCEVKISRGSTGSHVLLLQELLPRVKLNTEPPSPGSGTCSEMQQDCLQKTGYFLTANFLRGGPEFKKKTQNHKKTQDKQPITSNLFIICLLETHRH